MTRIQLTLASIASLIASAHSSAAILNGDLTGPVAAGTAPPSWFNWQKTPDTVDSGGPFNNTGVPWTLSPNGGTFVRAGGSTLPAQSEAIGQNVTGFIAGQAYSLEFWQANLGFEHPTSGAWNGTDGFWELYIDGTLVGNSSTLTKPATSTDPIAWSFDSIGFVAPAASFEVALVSMSADASGLAAYMGIDGITTRVVPAPTTGALIGVGAIAAGRRRRSKA